MLSSGDVVLTNVQFTDTFEVKKRPVLVLFEEFENVVVAGITSNLEMKGIPLTKKEGAIKDSVIKLNYILNDVNFFTKITSFVYTKDINLYTN